MAIANTVRIAAHSDEPLLSQLLREQSQVSAVELFSEWHQSTSDSHARTKYTALLPAKSPQPGQQYAFEVDLDACSGCKACVSACHTLNGLDEHETWRGVGLLRSNSALMPVLQHVTTACHHCIDPGCLKGCPVLAYEKDPLTGIVRHLDDQCFGCKYCTMMCPYEVPQYSQSLGIVRKCDMCSQRLAIGEAPACVQACPNSAIRISLVNVERPTPATEPLPGRLVPTAPSSLLTQPTTRYLSRSTAGSEVYSQESIAEVVQPGHLPLVAMLVLTQASVGLWFAAISTHLLRATNATGMLVAAIIATCLGIFGFHLALLHLGRPWLAFRSVLGWRTSWLSREAIAFGVYLGLSLTAALLWMMNNQWAVPASLVTIGVGVGAVFCSAMIYVATGRSQWSFSRTVLEFAATTSGLGFALSGLVSSRDAGMWFLLACLSCIVSIVPRCVDWFRAGSHAGQDKSFSARSGRLLRHQLAGRFTITCSLMLLSVLLLATRVGIPTQVQFIVTVAAVGLLFASQLLTRWLYFASVVFPRMPGAGS
jgi:formate dehydrogenase iron-sulfur subunit